MNFIKKNSIAIIILMLILSGFLSLGFGLWGVVDRSVSVLEPDYAAKNPEKNAELIEDESSNGSGKGNQSGNKLEAPSGGGSVSLIYAKTVDIDLSDKKANFLVANPMESTQYLVAEVVIQDQVVAQSGALKPGYRVTELRLADGANSMLREGGYDGKIVLYMYDEKTDERSIINSEIVVDVKVEE